MHASADPQVKKVVEGKRVLALVEMLKSIGSLEPKIWGKP